MPGDSGHSEDYFKSYRDFWWNADFLELMARRLNLAQCRQILDVGCGQCHWSSTLLPFLGQNPAVSGLDKDPKWSNVTPALSERFAAANATLELHNGSACEMPFGDNSFDMVTCQTVLIHLQDPVAAIKEMYRVVRPGGLVLCVEPNNSVQSLLRSSTGHSLSVEERLQGVRYALILESGKRILGDGDNSYGDFVAEALYSSGFEDIRVYLSDKTSPLVPPYDTPEQNALVTTMKQWSSEESGPSDSDTARRYFSAFGGQYDDVLASILSEADGDERAYWAQIDAQQYVNSGAVLMYLTSGRKPLDEMDIS